MALLAIRDHVAVSVGKQHILLVPDFAGWSTPCQSPLVLGKLADVRSLDPDGTVPGNVKFREGGRSLASAVDQDEEAVCLPTDQGGIATAASLFTARRTESTTGVKCLRQNLFASGFAVSNETCRPRMACVLQ